MTDKQFERIKKGLQFHSEGGIDNLCTMTETTLRAILDDATKELEKENAELKESGSVICDRLSERIDETVELKNENIGLKNQLTDAKEIIKLLLWDLRNRSYEPVKDVERAEQFLKEPSHD